jgi:hypothetical protein
MPPTEYMLELAIEPGDPADTLEGAPVETVSISVFEDTVIVCGDRAGLEEFLHWYCGEDADGQASEEIERSVQEFLDEAVEV